MESDEEMEEDKKDTIQIYEEIFNFLKPEETIAKALKVIFLFNINPGILFNLFSNSLVKNMQISSLYTYLYPFSTFCFLGFLFNIIELFMILIYFIEIIR